MITHKKGEYIGLAYGEYSDYRFNGLYRMLCDIDLADCAQRYYDAAPVCEWDDERKDADDCGLGAWLIANGMVEEIPYDEVHCGSYGAFDVAEVIERANKRGHELLAANGQGERQEARRADCPLDRDVGRQQRERGDE